METRSFKKLHQASFLTDDDRQKLVELSSHSVQVPAKQDIVRPKEGSEKVHLLVDGFACRYKLMRDGQKSIIAILVPGDFCDLQSTIFGQIDHSVSTLTPCRVVYIDRDMIEAITSAEPRILKAFWWATLVDEAILREWVVSMGRRSAEERLAHLLCELHTRLTSVDLVEAGSFPFPFMQEMLGDVLGLSAVHVNRVVRAVYDKSLARIQDKRVQILDLDRLIALADFDPAYLHLPRSTVSRRESLGNLAVPAAE